MERSGSAVLASQTLLTRTLVPTVALAYFEEHMNNHRIHRAYEPAVPQPGPLLAVTAALFALFLSGFVLGFLWPHPVEQ